MNPAPTGEWAFDMRQILVYAIGRCDRTDGVHEKNPERTGVQFHPLWGRQCRGRFGHSARRARAAPFPDVRFQAGPPEVSGDFRLRVPHARVAADVLAVVVHEQHCLLEGQPVPPSVVMEAPGSAGWYHNAR